MAPERVQVPVPLPILVMPPVPLMMPLIAPTPELVSSRVSRKPPLATALLKVIFPVLVIDHVWAAVSVVAPVVPAAMVRLRLAAELSTPYWSRAIVLLKVNVLDSPAVKLKPPRVMAVTNAAGSFAVVVANWATSEMVSGTPPVQLPAVLHVVLVPPVQGLLVWA